MTQKSGGASAKAKKDEDLTPAERRAKYPRDAKGFVVLSNGDTSAKVLPESVDAWLARGWSVEEDGLPLNSPETDPFAGQADDPENLEN